MKHICVPNSFDISFGYSGVLYHANSCDSPIIDYADLDNQCESAGGDPSEHGLFLSTDNRQAQFWVTDFDLLGNPASNRRGLTYGCTDEEACNYDGGAEIDDGSCYYPDENGECDDSDEGGGDGGGNNTVPMVGDSFVLKWRYWCGTDGEECISVGADGYELNFNDGTPQIWETRIYIDSYDPESVFFDQDTFTYGFYGNEFHTSSGKRGIWFIDASEQCSPTLQTYNFNLFYYDTDEEDDVITAQSALVQGCIHSSIDNEDLNTRATLNADGSYRSGYSSQDLDGYYTIEYNNEDGTIDNGGILSIYRDPPSEFVPVGTTYIGEFDSNGTITNGVYTKWNGIVGEFNAQLNKCNGSAYECQKDGYPVLPQSFDLRYEHSNNNNPPSPDDVGFYDCGVTYNYTLSRMTLNLDGTFTTSEPPSEETIGMFEDGGPVRRRGRRRKENNRKRINQEKLSLPVKPITPVDPVELDEEGIGREDRTRAYGTYELNLELGTLDLYYVGQLQDDGAITRTVAKSIVEEYPWKYGISRGSHIKHDGNLAGTFHTNPLVFERTQVGAYNKQGGSPNDDGDYLITVNRYLEDVYGRQGSFCLHRNPSGANNAIYCQPILGQYTGVYSNAQGEDTGIGYGYPDGNGRSKHFKWFIQELVTGQCDGCDTVVPDFFGDFSGNPIMDLYRYCHDPSNEWLINFGQPYQNSTQVSFNDPPGVISNTNLSCCPDDHYNYATQYNNGDISGCTDPFATNFECYAQVDDGSCIIEGCTDPDGDNYNPDATVDDGSCVYSGEYMGRILISEFNSNVGNMAQGEQGDAGFEYVELYNSLPFDVDISGWTLWGQKYVKYMFSENNCGGDCEFLDCPELYDASSDECCFHTGDQPMYTFPDGTVIRQNDFILVVRNFNSWLPTIPEDQIWGLPGQCWDGHACYHDLWHTYGNGGINVEEDYDGDGNNDFAPGEWFYSYSPEDGIQTGWSRLNLQTTGNEYTQSQFGWPAYYDGTQNMYQQGFDNDGSADCTGELNPAWENLDAVLSECTMGIYDECGTSPNDWTTACWIQHEECYNAYYIGLSQIPKRLNYHGIECMYTYYWDGSYKDFVIPNGPSAGEVIPNLQVDYQSACGESNGGVGPCANYYSCQSSCLEDCSTQNNGADVFCHPRREVGQGNFCVDGAYWDNDEWNTNDTYNGHGALLERCVANFGEDLSKFRYYDGTNASVANLFEWNRNYNLGVPNLSGVCPEKLWLTDRIEQVVTTMGLGKYRICSDNPQSEDDCTDQGMYIGTHYNWDGQKGTELVIPLDVDWNTFDINLASNYTQSPPMGQGGPGIGSIFRFENGYEQGEDAVYGCTDPTALNYNSDATIDDGSCEYDDGEQPFLYQYFCDDTGTPYDPCFNCNGDLVIGEGCVWPPDNGINQCTEVPLTLQQKFWWMDNYYMNYYNQEIGWKDAFLNPLQGEYVPYYQGNRECGPRMVVLPATSFPSMCDDWPQCREDNSCSICEEAYQQSDADVGMNHAWALLNLGGSCGTCSDGSTCYYTIYESYCTNTLQSRPSVHVRGKPYFTTSKEINNALRNPMNPIKIRGIDDIRNPIDFKAPLPGTHQDDIE